MEKLRYSYQALCSVPAGVKWRVLSACGLLALANHSLALAALCFAGSIVYGLKKDQ